MNITTVKKGTGATSSINDSARKHAVHQSKGFKTTIKPLGGTGAAAIELNAGDEEFAKYIDPLLNHAGTTGQNFVDDPVKRANLEFVVQTAGAKLWAALNSDQWRHREAAVSAFRDYLEAAHESSVLPNRYKTVDDKLNLFLSAIAIAKVAIQDKLL